MTCLPWLDTLTTGLPQPISIIDDTMVQDSILNDVNIPKTDEVVEKNIDVAVDQSFEEIQFEDSAEPLTVQNSDTVATGNPDLCFFFKPDSEIYNETLVKIQSVASDEVYYHDVCRQNFRNHKRSLVKSPVRTSWHISRETHETVYREICNLIEENVIKRGRCYFLSYLHKEYLEMFKELSEGSDVASIFAAHYLEEKIHKKFNDKIQILMSNKKKVVAPKGISNIDDSLFAHLKDQDTLQAAAAILREEILE
ncbi:hypothetical protein TNCV_2545251 [Trichonephila clavipes]|nr:hypothetical protein TNCV_2545251 [Trichonephila clavipes]